MTIDDDRLGVLARLPGDVLCLVLADGTPTYVSPAVERSFGYDAPTFLDHVARDDLVHPDDGKAVRQLWAEALAAPGAAQRAEVRIRNGSGAWRWVEVIATNHLHDPAVAGMVMNFRDITERRLVEDELREREERLRTIVNGTTDSLVLVDRRGAIQWCSPGVRDLLGYSPDEAVGRQVLDFAHPDDLPVATPGLNRMLNGRSDGEPITLRVRRANDRWRHVEVLSRRVEGGGGARDALADGVLFSLRDVTKRVRTERALRASEERERALLQNSTDAVVVVDAAGVITYSSSGLERLFGWRPSDVEGRSCFEFIHTNDIDRVTTELLNVAAVADATVRTEFRVLLAHGGWRWVEAMAANQLHNAAVRGVVTNVRDVSDRKATENALRAAEARFRTVVSASYDVTAVIDREGRVKWVTENSARLLGRGPAELMGTSGLDLVHPDDLPFVLDELEVWGRGEGVPRPTAVRLRHADGRWRDVEIVGTDFLDNPEINGIAINLRDVEERMAAERERMRLTDIFELTSDLVGIARSSGEVVYLNNSARRFFGVAADQSPAAVPLATYFTQSSLHAMGAEGVAELNASGIWSGEVELIRHDGEVVPMLAQVLGHRDGSGELEFLSGVLRDISERKTFENRLEHEASHDPLTSLPNRTLLLDRLEMALARARRRRTAVAVLFCDLDNFKVVNDSLGHSYGDAVLVEVAQRLHGQLRPGDTVSRFGGDEFVILCEDIGDADDAITVARRVDHAMNRAFVLSGREVFVGVSVGIAVASKRTLTHADPETLIRDADAAMYRAKSRGRGRYQVYEPGIGIQAVDRFDLDNGMRHALARGELAVHYQPMVALGPAGQGRDGVAEPPLAIVGVEALVRWNHPERGWLLPGEFIPLAEETGIVVPLGAWVLETACRQLRAWDDELPDRRLLDLAVNISGRQLAHADLVGQVTRSVADAGWSAERLHLEITESVLMEDAALSAATLRSVKDLGVKVSVDDFGTGYSSLSSLRHFPVDRLKVDRAFVDGLGGEPNDPAIVAAIVNLAHTLGLEAVGEGVETGAQLEALESLGCDLAQGYYLGRPRPATEVTDLLRRAR